MKPLTEKERIIAELLGSGCSVKQTTKRLVELGHHMAEATVSSRIRDIAAKVPNPHGLPPIAAIRLYIRTKNAA